MQGYTDGVTSTAFAWKKVKVSKLPPGGGRGAEGASKAGFDVGSSDPGRPPAGSQHWTVTYLAGSQCKFRVQRGRTVIYIEGFIALIDVKHALDAAELKKNVRRHK